MFAKENTDIQNLIATYFKGIYDGNVNMLENVFHTKALLFGDANGASYFKTVSEYLKSVKARKSPRELGEAFLMKIESIEMLGDQAMVKAHVPMLGFNYYDILALAKVKGEWKIVNKLYSHVS